MKELRIDPCKLFRKLREGVGRKKKRLNIKEIAEAATCTEKTVRKYLNTDKQLDKRKFNKGIVKVSDDVKKRIGIFVQNYHKDLVP
eukprot:448601-Prorocentrum_lima.AAC.2